MEGFYIFVLVLGGFIAAIFYIFDREKYELSEKNHREAAERELNTAWHNYQRDLEELRTSPNDPDLRRKALVDGRTYSNLTRNNKGVTIYDEVALKNDIDAACAGSVSVQKRPIEERLARLQHLLDAKHISEDEYRKQRQSILDEL